MQIPVTAMHPDDIVKQLPFRLSNNRGLCAPTITIERDKLAAVLDEYEKLREQLGAALESNRGKDIDIAALRNQRSIDSLRDRIDSIELTLRNHLANII